jgi:hypothetical protein
MYRCNDRINSNRVKLRVNVRDAAANPYYYYILTAPSVNKDLVYRRSVNILLVYRYLYVNIELAYLLW